MVARNPYNYWLRRKLIRMPTSGFTVSANGSVEAKHDLIEAQRAFGYTNEDLMLVLQPMGAEGHDAVWSMGDDTPLTVLSDKGRPFYSYFKQRFAQVTNPPIDPLREELVMSLTTYAGPRRSVLEESEEHAAVVELPSPVLMEGALERLKHLSEPHLKAIVLKCHFPTDAGAAALGPALERLCQQAADAVRAGAGLLILSDRGVEETRAPIPMLLATSAVHQHLIRAGLRTSCDLIVEAGDVWDIHHFACLIGYGASAVDAYLAMESVRSFAGQRGMETLDPQQAVDNFRMAVEAGLLKIMSKMGISTLSGYRGAQIFEAIGIQRDVVERHFPGTPTRIEGLGLTDIAADVLRRHSEAFGGSGPTGKRGLPDTGYVRFRGNGEYHGYNPFVVRAMHKATMTGDYDAYLEYVALSAKHEPAEIRDLLQFRSRPSIALDEVEPIESIVRRFYSTAMSLGALSPEAVQTLAIAMNMLGARSNSGEGGEDPDWYAERHDGVVGHNKIKQVASARFGVTSWYLSQAEELEIKIAQGSKPGEGGQLPKHKVNAYISRLRHAIPGIPLISPPPHHDIYSIEDLAQLIYDLKQANPRAHIGVKLVSEAGVGTIAAGVAKAYADYILISGDSGGTGASPLSSIKNAGCPWELGLAETQQVLVLNDLRGRVRLRTDGGLKTGRDVLIAAMLGAEEFGFGTSAVVAMGCDMARQCHLNTCPTGIATQREDLRQKFAGTPEMVVNYFTFLAREIREQLAGLGFRSLDDIIGRVDYLEQSCEPREGHASQLKLDALLAPPDPTFSFPYKQMQPRNDPPARDPMPEQLVEDAAPALEDGKRISLSYRITNANRTLGARVAYEISRRHGGDGLRDGTLELRFQGSAGQSFGAFLTRGMRLVLEGEANDYVGKGMGGGELVIVPSERAKFAAGENIILGNTVLYGATGGQLFAAGRAGERFAVRNSGATAVIEGAGDHCCEYMTGGVVVVLGPVGRNFAAGMSAGTAFVLDETGNFPDRVNPELVDIERVQPEDAPALRGLIEEHVAVTNSVRGREILDRWGEFLPRFWRVVPDPPTVQTHTPAMVGADTGTNAPNS
jgi:glutamate synthase (NADPH/NADH) large chain/glutamate synthase (ferredoxin)